MRSPQLLSDSKRKLLERVLRGEMARETWEAPLQPREPGTTVPLAPSQQQVWLHSQMGDTGFVYNEPITIHYHGRLDPDLFQRSFYEFLRRHEIWRTTFAAVDGQVVQLVQPKLEIEIPLSDLTGIAEEDREAEATRIATLDARRPFDLAVGPLLRGRLFKLRDDKYRFHLTLHHIIFDGVSIYRTVLKELAAIYNSFAKGEPSPLPEPRLQYGDYALWEHRLQQSPSVAEQVDYWREQLRGELPMLQLPADHARPPAPSHRGGMEKFALSPELSEAVKRRSKSEGVTHYMFLLASFKAMLHRLTGQQDILVGGVIDGRRRREFENLIGFFLNSIVLRTHPKSSVTFRDYLVEVRDTVAGALANGDVPFDRLVRELQPKREPGCHPFFQALFSIEPPATPVDLPWELTQMDVATGASKVDLYLEIDEHEDHLIARFIYNTDLFERSTVRRMVGHWLTLLEAAAADPGVTLRDLPMLTPTENRWLQDQETGPQQVIPESGVHDLFDLQARRTPDAIAVEHDGNRVTYRQLNEAATRLAHRLHEAGVGPETLVGLCVERSPKMVAALLGILKAGGAYVPIDPALPPQRIAMMMDDAKAPVILTESRLAAGLEHTGARLICCDESPSPSPATLPAPAIEPGKDAGNLAYVIYTSGSTGKPKGVEVSHRALLNLLLSMQREPGFAAQDKLLAVTTISFDIAGLELFLPLICGGCVVIANKEDARDPILLIDLLRQSRCGIMQATPATWRALVNSGWSGDSKLKILCGGEALPRDLAQQLLPLCGELWNMYGPTETTIWSTVHRVLPDVRLVPIGRPVANTSVYVLDPSLNRLPVGAVGELFIGGDGVARGYLGRPQLTGERFIANPFDSSERIYRTGDLARWLADGTIECLGRADNQVKIRGFRVEVEEIESVIADLPGVTGVAVKAWPDASGSMALVAYTCGAEGPDLRAALQQKLPEYMIPSCVVPVEALPLTPNGKLDRNALPRPEMVKSATRFVEPRTVVERTLASIFASVLNVERVSVSDSFFDLGGHSLLVAKLLRRIDLEFGRHLSMPAVFQSPSVEQLAPFLESDSQKYAGRAPVRPRVVNIQTRNTRAPLFWIRGGPYLQTLQSHVETPLITVALDPGEEASVCQNTSVTQVASCIVKRILETQPAGPYFLAGRCASGVIAFEAAVQLRAAGQEVALLALVESPNPAYYQTIPRWRRRVSLAAYHARRFSRLSGAAAAKYLYERLKGAAKAIMRPHAPVDDQTECAILAYTHQPYAGRIVVIQGTERPKVPDLRAGWQDVAKGRFEVHQVVGGHDSIFSEPQVKDLGKLLNDMLAEKAPQSETHEPRVKVARSTNRGGVSPRGQQEPRGL
jgi:amino acid adenylation domain-containing protein